VLPEGDNRAMCCVVASPISTSPATVLQSAIQTEEETPTPTPPTLGARGDLIRLRMPVKACAADGCLADDSGAGALVCSVRGV